MFRVKVRPANWKSGTAGTTYGLWHDSPFGIVPAGEVTQWPGGWIVWVNPRLVHHGVDLTTINGTPPNYLDRPVFPTPQAAAAAVLLTGVTYDEDARP